MKRGILYTLLCIFAIGHCRSNTRPLYSLKIRGIFGLVEVISASGKRRPALKNDYLYAGDSLVTGKNSRAEIKLPRGYLRVYASSLFTLSTMSDRKETNWPNYHFVYGKYLGRFKTKNPQHLIYMSSKSFFLSSSRMWFYLKVKPNSDVNLAVFSGSGLVNKNYQALGKENAKLIEASNILTNIDKYVKIGDVVSKNQRLIIKGNQVRVYNEQLNQMIKGAELALDYEGKGTKAKQVDSIIAQRMNLKRNADLSHIYDLKVKKIKTKKYRKKMRKRIKKLNKAFNLTKVRDTVLKKKSKVKKKKSKKS